MAAFSVRLQVMKTAAEAGLTEAAEMTTEEGGGGTPWYVARNRRGSLFTAVYLSIMYTTKRRWLDYPNLSAVLRLDPGTGRWFTVGPTSQTLGQQ